MNPRQYQEVMEIVDRVMDSPPEELKARIKQECPDEGLRHAVLNLLAEDKQGSRFLEDPPLSVLSSQQTGEQDSLIGQRVGHYRITEELGRGGMGAVYKGVREDEQYKTEVAIKLIKRGMDTDFILRRFRNERQIMANLHHPNIAPLLDGGTTEDGVPYFIMEYIDGRPINQYCDDKNLSITERLKLFRTVCSAVQYAHQNLVIHRDIKPGNILVTRDGTPKLLDFGIAKILGSDSAVQPPDPTATAFRVMTPEYASPEQVRGLQMTTASDVYSLGVLLYESLTGHRPYRFVSRRADEIARVICDQEPLKLATAYIKLGDLQGRPYRPNTGDSAGALASYRHAHQLLEPLAAKDSANVELESAMATVYERISFLSHRTGDLNAETDYKRRALALREGLWASDKGNREYRRRLADSYITLNDVEHYRRALELREELAREEPANTQNLRDLAQVLQRIGNTRLGDDAANNSLSFENNSRALALCEQIAASSSANVQDQRDLADQLMLTGDSLVRVGKARAAIENYERALGLFRSLALTDPANAEARRDLSFVHLKLGQAKTKTHDAGARSDLLTALHIAEELGKRNSNREDLATQLAIYEELAQSSEATGDIKTALEDSRKSLEIRQQLSSLTPDRPDRREELAIAYQNLGRLYAKSAGAAAPRTNGAATPWREARNWYQKSLEIWRDLRHKGTLRSAAAGEPDKVAREIARCNAALAKL